MLYMGGNRSLELLHRRQLRLLELLHRRQLRLLRQPGRLDPTGLGRYPSDCPFHIDGAWGARGKPGHNRTQPRTMLSATRASERAAELGVQRKGLIMASLM